MATFSVGDWVQITPQPDLRWSEWDDVHDLFCGKVGTIRDEFSDPDTGEIFYNVEANFPYGLDTAPAGWYYIHFKPDHIIHSTQYDSELAEHREKVERELQEWESFKKKSTDDALRGIFTRPSKQVTDDIRSAEERRSDVPAPVDLWDDVTEEIAPIAGSLVNDLPDYDDDDIDYLLQQYNSDPDIASIIKDDAD